MIITYPLNDVDYTAADAETYLCTRVSGVYSSESHFALTISGSRQISISPGVAWINNGTFKGKSVVSTETEVLTIDAADALPRKDLVVLRFDASLNASLLAVKKGEPASVPSVPSVQRTEGVYELGLYTVSVPAGSTEITPGNVRSLLLDETYCGVMRDGVTGIPTAQLQAEATAFIENLIANMSAQLTNITSATVTRGDGVGDPTCVVEFSDDASHVIFHFDNVNGQSVTHTFKDGILTFESASGKTTIDLSPDALGVYKKEQVVSAATKTEYGLGASATPDDVFKSVRSSLKKNGDDIVTVAAIAAQGARVSFGTIGGGTTSGQVVIRPGFKPVAVMLGTPDVGKEFMIVWRGCSTASKLTVSSSGINPVVDGLAIQWSDDSVSLGIAYPAEVTPYVVIGVPTTEDV